MHKRIINQFFVYPFVDIEAGHKELYNQVYYELLAKYSKTLQKMSEIEQESFRGRLYEMAKREIQPYGDEFIYRQDTVKKRSIN